MPSKPLENILEWLSDGHSVYQLALLSFAVHAALPHQCTCLCSFSIGSTCGVVQTQRGTAIAWLLFMAVVILP